MHDVLFFLGAGASAPFGIPTMKQFVIDFERFLADNGTEDEKNLYNRIKNALSKQLKREIDLEDIFTVIDGYIGFNYERLGLLAVYCFHGYLSQLKQIPSPSYEKEVEICKSLRIKFQKFVRDRCLMPEESFEKISKVYQDLFNRSYLESMSFGSDTDHSRGNYHYSTRWTIFTTNYDTCLEYYFRQVAKVPLNTGFYFDNATYTMVQNFNALFDAQTLRLFKLHGSISWLIDSEGIVTEEQTVLGQSLLGRKFVGEMMIYPVQQKELYLEPYISMFKLLNSELARKSIWIVIGYSFNDPVIREIFIRNSNENKKMILVHPNALDIESERLDNIKANRYLLREKFGEGTLYREVNYKIIKSIVSNPKFDAAKTPIGS